MRCRAWPLRPTTANALCLVDSEARRCPGEHGANLRWPGKRWAPRVDAWDIAAASMVWSPQSMVRVVCVHDTSTKPATAMTDAGPALIKTPTNPDGPYALVREWVGTVMAGWLGLPIFELAIMRHGADSRRERDGTRPRDDRPAGCVVHAPIRRRVQRQDLPWAPASGDAPLPPRSAPDHRQRAMSQPRTRGACLAGESCASNRAASAAPPTSARTCVVGVAGPGVA